MFPGQIRFSPPACLSSGHPEKLHHPSPIALFAVWNQRDAVSRICGGDDLYRSTTTEAVAWRVTRTTAAP